MLRVCSHDGAMLGVEGEPLVSGQTVVTETDLTRRQLHGRVSLEEGADEAVVAFVKEPLVRELRQRPRRGACAECQLPRWKAVAATPPVRDGAKRPPDTIVVGPAREEK